MLLPDTKVKVNAFAPPPVFHTENQYQQDEYKRGYDRMQQLEDLLQKEREDRIKSLNDQLAPIEAQMEKNFVDLEPLP